MCNANARNVASKISVKLVQDMDQNTGNKKRVINKWKHGNVDSNAKTENICECFSKNLQLLLPLAWRCWSPACCGSKKLHPDQQPMSNMRMLFIRARD